MKKIFLALAFLFISGFAMAISAQADPIWHDYNGHQYALTEDWMNWTTAQSTASGYDAWLVEIEDEAENSWLNTTFAGLTYGRPGNQNEWMSAAWIGLFRDSTSWYWSSTNAVATYKPVGSFSTGDTGLHAYIHISPHPWPSTWNNDGSHDGDPGNFYGIMEREIPDNPVSEPATMLLMGAGIAGLIASRRKKHI